MISIEKGVLRALQSLTTEAKELLESFDARINTLYDHKKITRQLGLLILEYKTHPDADKKQVILSLTKRLRQEILPAFSAFNPELAETTGRELARYEQNEIHDTEVLENELKNELTAPRAKEKLKQIVQGMAAEINQCQEDVNILSHIKDLIRLTKGFAEQERMLTLEEIELIQKTESSLNTELQQYEYDALAHSWKMLIEDVDRILRQEKIDVIDHFGPLFKTLPTIYSKVDKLFAPFKWITEKKKPSLEELKMITDAKKITAEDIARDVETFTSPGETQKYFAQMMKHFDLLDEKARAFIVHGSAAAGQKSITETKKLSTLAFKDQLTGLNRRNVFDRDLKALVSRKKQFSLLFMDIDHFKTFNDTYGHKIGDKVLSFVGELVKHAVRPSDTACRWGGEEIVALLPDATKETAGIVAERIRSSIEDFSKAFMGQVNEEMKAELGDKPAIHSITVSIGIATCPEDGTTEIALEKAADERVYKAKASGRNRIMAA